MKCSLDNVFQNLTEAVFYFRKDVKSNYEYFIFTMPILFAEMGGYIGLLGCNSLGLFKLAHIRGLPFIKSAIVSWILSVPLSAQLCLGWW